MNIKLPSPSFSLAGISKLISKLKVILTEISSILNKLKIKIDDELVSVKDYGATGDGVTDDTDAIQAAFDSGYHIHFPYGTYVISSRVDYVASDHIQITADRGTVIDATSVTDLYGVWISGQTMPASEAVQYLYDRTLRSGSQALSSNASKGDTTLTIPTALGLVAGDIIRISSSDLFCATSSSFYSGELAEVYSVASTTVTLTSPINDDYTAANTKIFKLVMPKVSVSNLTVLRDSEDIALQIWEARNVDVNNIHVEGATQTGLRLDYCYGGKVTNCSGKDFYIDGAGSEYGLNISSCQSLDIYGNHFEGGRHALSVGGYEPNRYLNIHNNTFSTIRGYGAGAFDMHGNIEHINVHHNMIKGGAYYCGHNVDFNHNIVMQYPSSVANGNYGICANIQKDCDYVNITNNVVVSHGDGSSTSGVGSYGRIIVMFEENTGSTVESVTVSDNECTGAVGYAHGNIHVRPLAVGITGCGIGTLRIEGNNTEITATSGVARNIAVDDGSVGAAALLTIERAYINNNYLSDVSGNGRCFQYSVINTSAYMEFNNNEVIWSLSPMDIPSAYAPITAKVTGNYIKRSSAGAGGLLKLYGCTTLDFTFNILENVTSSYYYDIQGITTLTTYGQTLINCGGGSANTATITTHVTAVTAY